MLLLSYFCGIRSHLKMSVRIGLKLIYVLGKW